MNSDKHLYTSAIIAAAGNGARMKSKISKQFIAINKISVLARTLIAFENASEIDEVIVVARHDDIQTVRETADKYGIRKLVCVVSGGETRQHSIQKGLSKVKGELVLIHDGARPFVTSEQINSVAKALYENDAAALGIPVADTLKFVDKGNITGTCDRSVLCAIQTPQGFKTALIKEAHRIAEEKGTIATDDCGLCESLGVEIKVITGSSSNIKITTPDDLAVAEGILNNSGGKSTMRVGHGYDVHKLTENRALFIGGVEIPYELGLLGHSDADVLIHAIMDSLLGAASLGDIGKLFPDTDDKWKGADSKHLLSVVGELLASKNIRINNIDATIIAQAPKLAPYIPDMIETISKILHIPKTSVSVKATTTEKLGFCGRGEGIAAEAVCCIEI